MEKVSFRAGLAFPTCAITMPEGNSLTKQAFADECNVNKIMERYELTGVLDDGKSVGGARHIDCTGLLSYQESLNVVMEAESSFMDLTAKVRSRFDNNPANMIEFLSNPANADEALALGLINGKSPEATDVAPKGAVSDAVPA